MDMRNGQRVATDSITLRGQPVPVILPNQSHKHSELRMAHILALLINSTEAGDLLRGNGALHAMLDAHARACS